MLFPIVCDSLTTRTDYMVVVYDAEPANRQARIQCIESLGGRFIKVTVESQ